MKTVSETELTNLGMELGICAATLDAALKHDVIENVLNGLAHSTETAGLFDAIDFAVISCEDLLAALKRWQNVRDAAAKMPQPGGEHVV